MRQSVGKRSVHERGEESPSFVSPYPRRVSDVEVFNTCHNQQQVRFPRAGGAVFLPRPARWESLYAAPKALVVATFDFPSDERGVRDPAGRCSASPAPGNLDFALSIQVLRGLNST